MKENPITHDPNAFPSALKPRVHVLLLEDDEDDVVLLTDTVADISTTSYLVTWVRRAEEAYEVLDRGSAHVCLVDYQLGVLNGIAFIKEAARRYPKIPFILLTGMTRLDVDLQAMEAGAADFIPKSDLNPLALERTLRYATAQKQLQADLLHAQNMAMEAAQQQSAFLATVAHEIRSPLTSILGFASILNKSDLTDEQSKWVGTIHQAGTDLMHTINDLLDFSKIRAGRLEIVNEPYDLWDLIGDVLEMAATMAARKGITLGAIVSPTVPYQVCGDAFRVRQVLNNLLSNAIKFTDTGTVVVRLKCTPSHLVAEVADTGIGISSQQQELLFDAFAQASAQTARNYGGTGLGLTICRQLVEGMGGTISVTSAPGEGSTFRFTLAHEAACGPAPEMPEHASVGVAIEHLSLRRLVAEQCELLGVAVQLSDLPQRGTKLWLTDTDREAAPEGMKMVQLLPFVVARGNTHGTSARPRLTIPIRPKALRMLLEAEV